MAHRARAAFAFALSLLVTGCLSTASAPVAGDVLTARREAFVAAFNRGDAAALKEFYAPDSILLSYFGQPVNDREMIAAGLARASSAFDLSLQPLRTRVAPALVYEAGTWQHFEKGTNNARESGTYLWSWRKEADGRWVIDVHAVNRRPPPPKP